MSTIKMDCSYGKKIQYVNVLTNLRHFKEHGKTSLQCLMCGQRLEIVVICNAL